MLKITIMKKNWIKTGDTNYSLFVNDIEAGQLEVQINTIDSRAIARIGDETYHLKRTGFWKTNIELTDASGRRVMHVFNKKWYANASILEYRGKEYQLLVRNNPLAEWAILDGEKDILAYGLAADNGVINIKITAATTSDDLLPDFLLWYLFAPIAQENTGGNFVFLMLLSLAQ
jgi:hypothetical protein